MAMGGQGVQSMHKVRSALTTSTAQHHTTDMLEILGRDANHDSSLLPKNRRGIHLVNVHRNQACNHGQIRPMGGCMHRKRKGRNKLWPGRELRVWHRPPHPPAQTVTSMLPRQPRSHTSTASLRWKNGRLKREQICTRTVNSRTQCRRTTPFRRSANMRAYQEIVVLIVQPDTEEVKIRRARPPRAATVDQRRRGIGPPWTTNLGRTTRQYRVKPARLVWLLKPRYRAKKINTRHHTRTRTLSIRGRMSIGPSNRNSIRRENTWTECRDLQGCRPHRRITLVQHLHHISSHLALLFRSISL